MKLLIITIFFFIACKTSSKTDFGGKTWQLFELNGSPVTADGSRQNFPVIAFETDEKKFNGTTGCNKMGGYFELNEGNRIRFYNVITTKMACMDGMELEARFLEVINSADNFNVQGDTLVLNKARMAPLARFKRS